MYTNSFAINEYLPHRLTGEIIEAYVKFIQSGEPFVIAKFAMSLDGKISTRSGQSKWITSEESRHVSRTLRGTVDGVLVGIGTVLQDNPMLTVRDQNGKSFERQPLRIILDSSARTPLSSNVLKQPGSTLIVTSRLDVNTENRVQGLQEIGAEVVSIPGDDGSVDIAELIKILGQRGILSLMVEGGSRVLGSFFDLDLVDKVVGFISPVILGGEKSLSPVAGYGIESISDSMRLKNTRTRVIGDDVMITGYSR